MDEDYIYFFKLKENFNYVSLNPTKLGKMVSVDRPTVAQFTHMYLGRRYVWVLWMYHKRFGIYSHSYSNDTRADNLGCDLYFVAAVSLTYIALLCICIFGIWYINHWKCKLEKADSWHKSIHTCTKYTNVLSNGAK